MTASRFTALFPVWALLMAALAMWHPDWLTPAQPAIVPLLGLVMFAMGMSLSAASFAAVLTRPRLVALGVGLQFALMPLLAWLLGRVLDLPLELAAGLILVGACPGGTASNVICYLGRGDLALSITLTAVSTLLAVFLTPLLVWLYIGQRIEVQVVEMLISVAKIILLPVTAGMLINHWLGHRLRAVRWSFPPVSVISIVLIIAIIVAINAPQMGRLAGAVAVAVLLHNGLGLLGGYLLPRLLGWDLRTCRTLAIEVGMQNSGLGVALAVQYFSAAAALPGALFSIWHNLSGAVLAGFWARRPPGAGAR